MAGVVDWNASQWEPVDSAVEPFEATALAFLGLALILAAILTTIGLFMFWWWSRPIALWMTILGVASMVFGEPVQSSIADALYVASYYLGGATLAAAYWSPISTRFERKT